MKNKKLSLIPLIAIFILAYFFYRQSLTQATYVGLPTVPCLDYTKPIVQDYSLNVSITISGKQYPIPKNFGHDYGQCLHDIYANDSTGKIYIRTNEQENFDLGNLFDVWHATFDQNQVFGYIADNGHTLEVFVNNQKTDTSRETPLLPDTNIKIVYK